MSRGRWGLGPRGISEGEPGGRVQGYSPPEVVQATQRWPRGDPSGGGAQVCGGTRALPPTSGNTVQGSCLLSVLLPPALREGRPTGENRQFSHFLDLIQSSSLQTQSSSHDDCDV